MAQRFTRWQTTVCHRLKSGSQTQVDEPVHVPGFLFRNVVRDIEAGGFSCKLAGKAGSIKLGDEVDTGISG
jgi:hypothetical protein